MRARTCSRSARCCTRWRPARLPFHGESSGVIFKAILDSATRAAIRFNRDIPPKLEDIINKALEKDRNLRYQHAAEMRADLQRLKRDTETGEPCCSSGTVAVAQESGGQLRNSFATLWVALAGCSGKVTLEDCGSRRSWWLSRWSLPGFYYRSHQAEHRLTDKDTIVLADFANSTGDAGFRRHAEDGTQRFAATSRRF